MIIKRYAVMGVIVLAISSLVYMEIKEIKDVFDGDWSFERERQRQKMIEEGLNYNEIKQNLKEKNYNKEDYVTG